ncbi:MAG TPA: FtsX-like permease family protein [Bryobacteraceae bacterium]|nr:FtsX-like permease family protein [Bryobacteraceae bacterium]
MEIVARLRPGVALAQALAETSVLRDRYSQEAIRHDPTRKGFEEGRLEIRSIARGTSPFRDQVVTALWLLLAGAFLLLLMVSANVGSLLLARASAREKETAIMLALGAPRSRIARLWLTESLILTVAGGVLGTWAAWQTLPLWLRWLPPARGIGIDTTEIRTRALDLHPDFRVAAFGIAVCAAVALLSSLAPAWRSSRRDLWSALKIAIGDARHRRFQSALCALQIAICTVLLVFSGLMLRTLGSLKAANTGIDENHIAVFRMDPLTAQYNKQQAESVQWRLVDGARALPGVEAAAIASRPLMRGIGLVNSVVFPGQPPGAPYGTSINTVSPEYFETMGMKFTAGHGFERREPGPHKPAPVVVNRAFVRRFLKGRNPVGQMFAAARTWVAPEFEIIGVVNDTKYRSLREVPPPIYYTSDFGPGREINSFVLQVRTRGNPAGVIPAVQKLLASIDPRASFYEVETLQDDIARSLWQERMLVALGTAFGIFAIVLAAIGLYGILAYFITGRRREIGLRMALGALPVNVSGLLLKQLMPTAGAGLAGGAITSVAAGMLVRSLAYGVSMADPRSLASALAIIVFVTLAAMAVPTWRALHVDPASALRQE